MVTKGLFVCFIVYSLFRHGQSCNHVAGLLFFLERHFGKGTDLPTELSCTSHPMTWTQAPRKVVNACAVSDMQFVKLSQSAADEDSETSTKLSPHLDPGTEKTVPLTMQCITSAIASCCFKVSPGGCFCDNFERTPPPV